MVKLTVDELLMLSPELLKGKIVCFPTDTVYGIGALIDDVDAIKKIYQMKHRNPDKPLAILCSTVGQLNDYVKEINDYAHHLMNYFWPGALTIIYEKSEHLSSVITRGLQTIAFRMPDSKVALRIIDHFGLMATTSVNESGNKELNDVEEIAKEFENYIDYLITDEEVQKELPSTVVDSRTMKVLRQGSVVITNNK